MNFQKTFLASEVRDRAISRVNLFQFSQKLIEKQLVSPGAIIFVENGEGAWKAFGGFEMPVKTWGYDGGGGHHKV